MITAQQLETARDVLAGGGSLGDAAAGLGVRPSDLDLALWRNLGGRRPTASRDDRFARRVLTEARRVGLLVD